MKIVIVIGTRPEAIKMAPVVLALKKDIFFNVKICLTGQHKTMVDSILNFFNIPVDVDFHLMTHNQTLADVTSRVVTAVSRYLESEKPDLVLVQGDTTTAFAASLAAFYNQICVGHIEAGLRTWNKLSPFPEEFNRAAIAKISDLHFAPTNLAKENLLKDNIEAEKIHVTGNTVIDALFLALENINFRHLKIQGLSLDLLNSESKLILITGHRRENHGNGFERISEAIFQLAQSYKNVQFVYPVHLNPNVRNIIYSRLDNIKNVHLIEPLDYPEFVYLMQRSYFILTDSGGVQEEAPSFGKPVLVMRDTTERPEGVEAGIIKLIGTNIQEIVKNCKILLDDPIAYNHMSTIANPYGDGNASNKIIEIIKSEFQ